LKSNCLPPTSGTSYFFLYTYIFYSTKTQPGNGAALCFYAAWRNLSQELKNISGKKREAGKKKNNKTLIADLHGFVPAPGTSSVV